MVKYLSPRVDQTPQELMAGGLLVVAHTFSILEGHFHWSLAHILLLSIVVLSGFRKFALRCLSAFTVIYALIFWSWIPGTFFLLTVATLILAWDLSERWLLRWGLFAAYFLALFHKLNWDFFNPAVSCAQEILTLRPQLIAFKDWQALRQILPAAAIAIESMMSFGLLWSLTLPWALLTALGMHLVMVFAQIYTLPQIMVVMCTGFFSFNKIPRAQVLRFLGIHSLIILPFIVRKIESVYSLRTLDMLGQLIPIHAVLGLSFCLSLLHLSYFILSHRLLPGSAALAPGLFHSFKRPLFLGLIILWGLQPYLGLSTSGSMSMHSNLRTEQNGNHILLGHVPALFTFQEDAISWPEYLSLTRDCPHFLAHGRSDLTPLAQWGRAPFGQFQWIPRFEVEKTLSICRRESLGLRGLITLRPFDAPGPNQCRK